jgi:hypothetical protein
MSIFFWIVLMIVCGKLADGASELMKARASRISGGSDPGEIERLRGEVQALNERLDVTERAALSADEKVRFMERLLASPIAVPIASPAVEAPRSPNAAPMA